CRYIILCRCGYQVGFLSEDEAWGRIMPMARAIQAAFPSWSELGEDYLVGREYWSIAETKKSGQYFRELEAWLVREPGSLGISWPGGLFSAPAPARRCAEGPPNSGGLGRRKRR